MIVSVKEVLDVMMKMLRWCGEKASRLAFS